MKKLIFLILCVCGWMSCTEKRPAVIEHPVFDTRNSGTLEIAKIEMTDSATVFYIDAFYRPGQWIRIDEATYIKESGGEDRLLVTRSEGINLNEEFYMPESGETSFKLFFPPLNPNITKIDLIESDCEGCFKTWGIYLLPHAKVKIDPVPAHLLAAKTQQPLPKPVFTSKEKTVISGKLAGYVEAMKMQMNIYYNDRITDSQNLDLPLAADGTCSAEIPIVLPGIVYTTAGPMLLFPGENREIYVDLKRKARYESRYRTDKEPGDSVYTYTSGTYINQNELNAVLSLNIFDYQELIEKVVNMKAEEYKAYMLDVLNRKLAEIPATLSDNAKLLMDRSIKLEVIQMLLQYESFLSYAYRSVHHLDRDGLAKSGFRPEKPGPAYYSFLTGMLDDYMAYLPRYQQIINALQHTEAFTLPDGQDKPIGEQFAYFKGKIGPLLGTDQGMFFDIALAQMYAGRIQKMDFFTDADKQALYDTFNAPAIADILIAENDRTVALIEANKNNKESVAHETPKVSNEKLFDTILAGYKGKVVFVDFWATWCGPCMQAHKAMLPLKEELKGKDIVFLYVTGETSPLANWSKAYPEIHGEHYRVSNAQWEYLSKAFNIEGIPTYLIYDRKGKQSYRTIGFSGVETMKKEIEKQL